MSWQAAYHSFHSFFISLPAPDLPPSSLPSISLRHAHQHSQVGAFNGRWCVQSDSGKGQPLPNQSTYLIPLSQGQGLTNNTPDKTGENYEGRQKSRNAGDHYLLFGMSSMFELDQYLSKIHS